MTSPKISVIIPIYNAEKYIARCLDSILGQGYDNIETLCLDDLSTDKSCAIISEYAQKDNRIHLIENKVNQGPGILRNIGLKKATGDWVLFCDADDWFEKGLFPKLAKIITDYPTLNIIEFRFNLAQNEQEKQVADWLDRGKSGIRQVSKEDIMLCTALWNKCYKKSFLLKYQLYEKAENERTSCGEIPLVIMAFLLNKEFYYLNEIGYNWRKNDNSLSRKNKNAHWMSFFSMLTVLKDYLILHHLYNEAMYDQIVIRILSWKLNVDVGTDYHKTYYKQTRDIFKNMKIKKSDFKYKHDYKIFKKTKYRPYIVLLFIKKLKELL